MGSQAGAILKNILFALEETGGKSNLRGGAKIQILQKG